MKKHTYIGLILFLTLAFALTSNPAFARGRHRHKHRWEDVAIGIGIAVLGDILYHNYKGPPPPIKCESQSGHWEVERVWVPETYKKVWNPGHYNRHGHWVKGRWIRIVGQEGYWIEREIWVSP